MHATTGLPATQCLAICPLCRGEIEFPLFLASFCNFTTFYGAFSGTIYRLDESFVHYGVCTREAAIEPAALREHGADNVIELPGHIFCPHCNQIVEGQPFAELQQLGEVRIPAVQLPLRSAGIGR